MFTVLRDVRWRFWLAVGLQFLILLSLMGLKQYTVLTGQRIMLETVPVDPRSLFRGDYVILDYRISRISLGNVEVDQRPLDFFGSGRSFHAGETAFVVLRQKGDFWVPRGVYHQRPKVGKGQVMIRGEVVSARSGTVQIEYGIESYFVPEGTGRAIERAWGSDVTVEVAVDNWGNAVVRRVFIDGEPFEP